MHDDPYDDASWDEYDPDDEHLLDWDGGPPDRYDRSILVRAVAAIVVAAMILVVLGSVIGFARGEGGGDGGAPPAPLDDLATIPATIPATETAASAPVLPAAPSTEATADADPPISDPVDAGAAATAPTVAPAPSSSAPAVTAPAVTAPAGTVAVGVPDVDAAAYVVYDVATGRVLAEQAADEQRPVGSVIKLLTAYVVMQAGDPTKVVTAPDQLLVDPTESNIGIYPGQALPRDVLLRAMMIVSANDAARALAVDVAGSEAAFVERMNVAAAELGLANTVAGNPVGLDTAGAHSSARDVLALGLLLMQDPTFRATVARPSATLNGQTLPATNDLLRTYPGADGVKTGRTTQAGFCLVGSATRDGRTVMVAVLGSPSDEARLASATALLDWGFANG